jgi:hypothetical protein
MPSPDPTPLAADAFQVAPPRIRRPWWLRLLVVFGGLMLLLFGGCLILSLFCRAEHHESPAKVLSAAQEITAFELPAGYAGESSEVVETPMFAVRKAIFRHESGQGVIALTAMEIRWQMLPSNDEGFRAGLDQLAGDMRPLIDVEASQETVVIGGKPVEFEIRDGQDALSSTKLHEVRGMFPTKAGMAQLWWQAEDAIWSAESQAAFIKSLAD